MKFTQYEVADAKKRLLSIIHPGSRVFTILRHCSASGMFRVIDMKVIAIEDGKAEVYHIGYNVAVLLGLSYDTKREGIKISGCGMDMGFHLVYSLGSVLFGRGEQCEALGYHTGRNGMKEAENDGGYLLKHAWL